MGRTWDLLVFICFLSQLQRLRPLSYCAPQPCISLTLQVQLEYCNIGMIFPFPLELDAIFSVHNWRNSKCKVLLKDLSSIATKQQPQLSLKQLEKIMLLMRDSDWGHWKTIPYRFSRPSWLQHQKREAPISWSSSTATLFRCSVRQEVERAWAWARNPRPKNGSKWGSSLA